MYSIHFVVQCPHFLHKFNFMLLNYLKHQATFSMNVTRAWFSMHLTFYDVDKLVHRVVFAVVCDRHTAVHALIFPLDIHDGQLAEDLVVDEPCVLWDPDWVGVSHTVRQLYNHHTIS